MSENLLPAGSLTRRDLVKRAAGLAAVGAGSVLGAHDASAVAVSRARRAGVRGASSHRGRVAIIGAGAGGVAAAYFVAGTHEIDLFEARSKIGGHCDSHVLQYRGQRVTVDIGAQFFHPDTHPIYVALLQELGLFDPGHPSTDDTSRGPASLCIFPAGAGAPIFSSSHALSTPQRAGEFASFTGLARRAVLHGLPWETTLETWIRSLPVSRSFKVDVLYPWLTALIGSSRADALRASARSILQTFALAFPADISQAATTYNSTIGLQGNLQRMLDRTSTVSLHLSSPAQTLDRTRAGWFLDTPGRRHGPYRSVVLNAPARVGHQLLSRVPAFVDLAALLNTYEYFESRLLIHTDPAYMDHDRGNWSSYNAEVGGHDCEGSVWYALHGSLPAGGTLDMFKSWATRRRADPAHILLERRFQHPVMNRSAISAARALRRHQGRRGLYFSGQYTTGFDAQESAAYSAMKVAESLAPDSHTLRSLKTRLRTKGLAGVSYEL